MDCAGKGSGRRCSGLPTRRCSRCQAVAYCSISHQTSHWSVHKKECERLKQQMKFTLVLNDFPFTFAKESTTQIIEKGETRCLFLIKQGVHCIGMWKYECRCEASASSTSLHCSRLIEGWNLSSSLSPCKGPEKELHQLAAFSELHALFPGVEVHIDFVGPAIPQVRDGERIDLSSYPQCIETDCECKLSVNCVSQRVMQDRSSKVTLQLHAGYYHELYRDLFKGSSPDLILAPNAGIAAYMSWLPTIELIKESKVAAFFSDYCEEAAHLGSCCIRTITGCPPTIPIQLNPFRQPLVVEDSALFLPCYSNCFLFGI